MTVAKLLIYGLTDDEDFYTDFYFNPNEVQAVFMADEKLISIVLSGQIYEIQYNLLLLNEIKDNLKLKTLGFN